MTILDTQSKTYFIQQGRAIGFVKECINANSLKDKADDSGISVTRCADLQFDGLRAIVYALPASTASAFTSGDDPPSVTCQETAVYCEGLFTAEAQCSEERVDDVEPLYVAEVSTSTDPTADDYSTYVFDRRPDENALRRAHSIQTLKHELCFGELAPTFVCRECGRRTHWLSTPRNRTDPLEVTPDIKLQSLRKNVCGGETA
ncbi:hypothetical protein ACOZ4I_17770 (plasmid) [Haloarcula salina]|uniref:hypothetical protein n=1 Tax=Haloarcula salina TaxID=1429914 RepID=UPI003C6FC107